MKRVCIFFFYDNQGKVDGYVDVLLNGLAGCVDKFIVVCNGKLTSEGRRTFRKYTDRIIVRENQGLDVWAYKTGIDDLGWDEICSYDEMIMMNHTICGPIFPFEDMFAEMDSRDVDFWGITTYFGGLNRPKNWPDNGFDTIQDHLQSHFIAVRKHMLRSYEFQKYWRDIPPINSYEDSVSLHESVFTKKFADMGFTRSCYVNCRSDYNNYPLMIDSHELIRKEKCPIIKRKRNVYQPYKGLILHDLNYGLRDMFEAIRDCTDYDTDLLIENTVRTSPLFHFQRGTLTDFISSEKSNSVYKPLDRTKTAVILNINNAQMYSYFKELLGKVLGGMNVIIIAHKVFDPKDCPAEDINVIAGYDRESDPQLFEVMEEYADRYEYFISLSFNTLKRHSRVSYDVSTLRMQSDSFAASEGQMNYTADLFENNKLLGLMVPPVPTAYTEFREFNLYRKNNAEYVSRYAEFLDVPNSEDNRYFFPADSIFACRSSVIKGFTESIVKCFGSDTGIPYALLLPLYVQSKNFFTARVMTDYNAKILFSLLENIVYNEGVIK